MSTTKKILIGLLNRETQAGEHHGKKDWCFQWQQNIRHYNGVLSLYGVLELLSNDGWKPTIRNEEGGYILVKEELS